MAHPFSKITRVIPSPPIATSANTFIIMLNLNLFAEFIDKLHSTYQALISGTYRPGQIVVALPTSTRPTQHKSALPPPQATPDTTQANSGDGVEVHSFLEAILQIIHASGDSFRYLYNVFCIMHRFSYSVEWCQSWFIKTGYGIIIANPQF